MKKIGILTFHNTTNYGAILQCYALQKYINNKQFCCEVINYNNKFLKENYNINPFCSKSFKEFVKKTLYFIPEKKNKNFFKKFTNEYIKISNEKYDESSIKNANDLYDMFIVGSDQVWNYSLSGKDSNYFLEFCNEENKKYSYAASFGTSILPDKHKEQIIKYLKKQRYISVREDEMLNNLKDKLTEKKIVQSIDPVFLLSKDDWESMLRSEKKIKEKYIFVYEVARTPLLRKFVQQLSDKYNLKVLYLSKAGKKMKNVKRIYSATPTEFLGYIKNAEYIVTSSFHGMAFSLIFEKNFYFDVPGNKKEFGSRLNSLSRICDVDNRKIIEDFAMNDFNIIPYNDIKENLGKEVEKSYKYLNDILSENG